MASDETELPRCVAASIIAFNAHSQSKHRNERTPAGPFRKRVLCGPVRLLRLAPPTGEAQRPEAQAQQQSRSRFGHVDRESEVGTGERIPLTAMGAAIRARVGADGLDGPLVLVTHLRDAIARCPSPVVIKVGRTEPVLLILFDNPQRILESCPVQEDSIPIRIHASALYEDLESTRQRRVDIRRCWICIVVQVQREFPLVARRTAAIPLNAFNLATGCRNEVVGENGPANNVM
jgi:hypothetical protein